MGLHITGVLLPDEITPKQWEAAYEEALRLVDAYDFLDIIRDSEKYAKYGLTWCYAEKSKEREIDGDLGVGIYGAYSGCISAEDQILYRGLYQCLPEDQDSDGIIQPEPRAPLCRDALIGRLYDYEDLEKYQDYQRMVFGNKTQGYPHHVPLLAICLLLEDRLGKAFTVHGNITRGQIKAAAEWANTILDKPISLPCTMDNAKLMARLQAFVPRQSLLASFMDLTFCAHDEDMYRFLQKCFSEEELADYWKKELFHHVPGTLGSSRFFRKYFNMTDNLVLLTRTCADKYTPEEFAKALASSRVFEREKNTNNPVATLSTDSDRKTPETIETVMGKMFALLGGGLPHNSAVARYIPLERGIRDVTLSYEKIGETGTDFEALLRNAIEEAAPKNKLISENLDIFDELSNLVDEQTAPIDIIDPEDLVFYELGDILTPGIQGTLKNIREFVDTHKEEARQNYLKNYADEELSDKKFTRLAVIVKRCNSLLPKSIWDMFEQRIEDDDFFFTLLGVYTIKSDTLPFAHYVKGLLYNPVLFEQMLLSDDVSWLNANET